MHSDRSNDAGFSLIETVAAMGILALAALPMMEIASDAVSNAARLETRMLARTVAENVISLTLAEPEPLDSGVRTGQQTQLGRAFDWVLVSGASAAGGAQSVQVEVMRAGDAQVLARLVSLKALPAPPPIPAETTQ